VGRIYFYQVKPDAKRVLWRVDVPVGLRRYRSANFKYKKAAERFYLVVKRELKKASRWSVLDFLTSGNKLWDAVEALRLLGEVDKGHWTTRLRRAAALLVMLEENIARKPGPFVEPLGRGIELSPQMHRLLVALARRKGAEVNDLVAGYLSRMVKEESEAGIVGEGRIRVGDMYRSAA
jgi:hypothetical protein